jgi:hypothetical protein
MIRKIEIEKPIAVVGVVLFIMPLILGVLPCQIPTSIWVMMLGIALVAFALGLKVK